jgi:putative transposase
MSFALIEARKAERSMELPAYMACAVLNVSVSGYYAWKRREASPRQRRNMVLLAHIRAQFVTSHEAYGSPRMHVELKEDGLVVGKHRVARLMRDNGLKARQKTRFKKTTDSDHAGPIAPNLLDQDFQAERPDQKWAVDISYIWTAEGWLYLAIMLDLFSRRIIGWAISDRMKRALARIVVERRAVLARTAFGNRWAEAHPFVCNVDSEGR